MFIVCPTFLQLTHAEAVRVGQAGPDLHLAIGALGACLAGPGVSGLGEGSRAAALALRVPLEATRLDNTLTTPACGARRTLASGAQKEEAMFTFTLYVLMGGAGRHHGHTGGAPGAAEAAAEAFRGGVRS